MNVKFHDWNCKVIIGAYPNGRKAIQLFDDETGEPIATASVNLPDLQIEDDQVFIKDYSENEGILDCLVKAGVVSSPLSHHSCGPYAVVPLVQLLYNGE